MFERRCLHSFSRFRTFVVLFLVCLLFSGAGFVSAQDLQEEILINEDSGGDQPPTTVGPGEVPSVEGGLPVEPEKESAPLAEAGGVQNEGSEKADTAALSGAVSSGKSSADVGLEGLEIADEKSRAAVSEKGQAGVAEQMPLPAKSEQGFQEMLDRKGRASAPTVDAVKKMVAQQEGLPFDPGRMRSMFFTHWQYQALLDAKKSRGNVRAPTQSELNALGTVDKVKPANRDISLNGIVFVSEKDWTIWLNGMRVTPSAIPREVMDLQVHKHFIEVKWLDDYTNQIFPIRLRAHQRFNLDTRIFLPG